VLRHAALAGFLVLLPACSSPPSAVPSAVSDSPTLAAGEFSAGLNGLKLWFRVAGSGPVCIMPTPAWGPSSDLYFRTLAPLEKFFTVVYLDSRGTGRSERAGTPTGYTWEALVSDIDALRVHLKQEKIWLMGHSEGGAQVLHYAVAHPDRVSGLVLLDALAASTSAEDADMQTRMARRSKEPWFADASKSLQAEPTDDKQFAAVMAKALPLYWSDPAKIARHAPHFAATSMSVAAARGGEASKRFPFDLRPRLDVITAPALVVVGDDDFICPPPAATAIHLGLKHSKLLLVEKSGHFPWLEQPDVFFREVPRFLEAMGLRAA
jgi:proline iminopeptidase